MATAMTAFAAVDDNESEPLNTHIAKGMDDKCKIKILCAVIIILIAIIVAIVLCGIYADAFGRYKQSESNYDHKDIDIDIPNGNQFDFDTTACENYRHLWEDPSIPLHERNQIGRAIFQTPAKIKQAIKLIKYGKTYDLYRPYSRHMPTAFGRYLNTTVICNYFPKAGSGTCTQQVITNALGNIGTQFDGFGHWFYINYTSSDEPPNEDFVFFNNFRGNQVFNHHLGESDDGVNYLGVDKLPTFFTRGILVDIAGYKGVLRLQDKYNITTADIVGALQAQSLSVEDIKQGDAVLVYTGWGMLVDTDPDLFFDLYKTPGVTEEVVLDILFPRNVMIVGSDNWGVDYWNLERYTAHQTFLTCGGGFIHEMLKLDEWIKDARNGTASWIGAYVFQPLPVLGAVASPGKPTLFV